MFGTEDEITTLNIYCQDMVTKLEAVLSYSVFEQLDVITRNIRLINRDSDPVWLEKVMSFTVEDYAERIILQEADQKKMESYALYESYFTDESWPRPYIAGEDAARLSELRTDIFTTLTLKRAEWITGVADIDAEYDTFAEDMKKMGIDEFIEIMQKTYDNYLAATE